MSSTYPPSAARMACSSLRPSSRSTVCVPQRAPCSPCSPCTLGPSWMGSRGLQCGPCGLGRLWGGAASVAACKRGKFVTVTAYNVCTAAHNDFYRVRNAKSSPQAAATPQSHPLTQDWKAGCGHCYQSPPDESDACCCLTAARTSVLSTNGKRSTVGAPRLLHTSCAHVQTSSKCKQCKAALGDFQRACFSLADKQYVRR